MWFNLCLAKWTLCWYVLDRVCEKFQSLLSILIKQAIAHILVQEHNASTPLKPWESIFQNGLFAQDYKIKTHTRQR